MVVKCLNSVIYNLCFNTISITFYAMNTLVYCNHCLCGFQGYQLKVLSLSKAQYGRSSGQSQNDNNNVKNKIQVSCTQKSFEFKIRVLARSLILGAHLVWMNVSFTLFQLESLTHCKDKDLKTYHY